MHISLTRVPLSFLLTTPPLHRIQPASFETSSTPNLEYNTCVRYLIPTTSRPPILGTGTATIKTPRPPTHSKTHGLWNGKAPSRPLRRGAHSPSQCQCAKEGVTRKLLSPYFLFLRPVSLVTVYLEHIAPAHKVPTFAASTVGPPLDSITPNKGKWIPDWTSNPEPTSIPHTSLEIIGPIPTALCEHIRRMRDSLST
jgi:hypothetical protein